MSLPQPKVEVDPTGGPPRQLMICHKFGCTPASRVNPRIPAETWTRILQAASELQADVKTAAAERLFIAWFASALERVVALQSGWFTPHSGGANGYDWALDCRRGDCGPLRKRIGDVEARLGLPGLSPNRTRWSEIPGDDVDNESGKTGGMDCIDNAVNAATYLELMSQSKLLEFHHVDPTKRYAKQFLMRALIIPWAHYSAVFVESATGVDWVLDLWAETTGVPGLIATRTLFQKSRRFWRTFHNDVDRLYEHLGE